MDDSTKVNIKIEYFNSFSLNTFNAMMRSFEDSIKSFTNTNDIVVEDVRSGSIEFVFAILENSSQIFNVFYSLTPWLENIKLWYNRFKVEKPEPHTVSPKQADIIYGVANFNAESGSNIYINTYNNTYNIDKQEDSKKVVQNIEEYRRNLSSNHLQDSYVEQIQKEVFMWEQYRVHTKGSGDKGIISKISQNPVKVLFDDENIKRNMTHSDNRFDVEWQELHFVVDAEVVYSGEKIVSYKIQKLYEQETFVGE